MLNDNLMTRDEVVSYLKDDFRIDLRDIARIVCLDNLPSGIGTRAERITHHRYNLFFDRSEGTLYIQAIEGRLRVRHLEIEARVMSLLTGRTIPLEDMTPPLEGLVEGWLERVTKDLSGRRVHGVLIGSPWNFNFYLRLMVEGGFGDLAADEAARGEQDEYVEHQLAVAIIEEEYLSGGLELSEDDKRIFREGHLPDDRDRFLVRRITQSIAGFGQKKAALRERGDLVDYLRTDYLYFSDLRNGTDLFRETLARSSAKIVDDPFLGYQLITVKGATYINFSWASSEVLSAALGALEKSFGFKKLYMYGKCGSLSPGLKVGQIVTPSRSYGENGWTDIENEACASGVGGVRFICVESPLVETREWAEEALRLGCDCVDMELDHVLRSVSDAVKKTILYYVSDQPLCGHTLSNRLSLVQQRLACSRSIIESIASGADAR